MTERISLREAAAELGVSVDTIRRRIADGTLPAERIGPRLLRVRRSDVEAIARPVPGPEQAKP
ncbi:helix-turn-helix transcriptional regulator [Nocardioides ochotonae]|uniref:helix-turn-helix transcriptional regulator n=1 Tax=Nocardioides ochotonae TaxID=2685869 RepID=UPI00140D2998|nr:excisionase family DNA-binding protein [Nocardioides ochotonae]